MLDIERDETEDESGEILKVEQVFRNGNRNIIVRWKDKDGDIRIIEEYKRVTADVKWFGKEEIK